MIWHQLQLLILEQGKNFAFQIPQTRALPAKTTAHRKVEKSFVCTVKGKFNLHSKILFIISSH